MSGLAGNAKRLQVLRAVAIGNCIRDIGDRLRRLSDRDGGNDLVGQRVDGREGIGVFKTDIDARAIARGPDAVRQIADRNGRDLFEIVGAERPSPR